MQRHWLINYWRVSEQLTTDELAWFSKTTNVMSETQWNLEKLVEDRFSTPPKKSTFWFSELVCTTCVCINVCVWIVFQLMYFSEQYICSICGTCACVTSVPRSSPLVLSVLFSFTAPLKSNLTITVSGSARGRVQTVVKYKLQQALTRPCWTLSYLSVSTSSHPVWHHRTSECVWTCCLILAHFFVFTGIL